MDVLVVGAGAMGRWLAGTVGDVADVAVADVDPDAAAATSDAVDAAVVPVDGDERFDAVCVAVPLPEAPDVLAEQAPRAERALLDVSGAMVEPVAAMERAAPDRERVSLHPLFAPENAPGSVAVVADAPGPVTDGLRDALAARGNDLFETTPAEHDRAMESVQAAAHAAVLAYGLAAGPVREEFHTPVSAGLEDLLARVTGGESRVYADVQAAFEGADAVAEAAERLADADHERFRDLYARARREDGPAVGSRADDAEQSTDGGA